jgi:hypothetical protein
MSTTTASLTQEQANSYVLECFKGATDPQNFFANVTVADLVEQYDPEDHEAAIPLFETSIVRIEEMLNKAVFEFDEFDAEYTDDLIGDLSTIYARAWERTEVARWIGDDMTSQVLGPYFDESVAKDAIVGNDLIKGVEVVSCWHGRRDVDALYFAEEKDIEELSKLCQRGNDDDKLSNL